MTDKELIKMALDALKNCSGITIADARHRVKAIEALRAALAQPEPEPVGWGVDWGKAGDIPCVSIIRRKANGITEVIAVEYAPFSYTAPPQRKWQGLTEADKKGIFNACEPDERSYVIAMTEALLKEKNHG